MTQRPWPGGAEDIGTWQDIFDLVIAAAVITNGALIVFTMPVLNGYDDYTRFWIFVGFQWVLYITQYTIRLLIPDVPLEVTIQAERAAHYNAKLIERVADVQELEYVLGETRDAYGAVQADQIESKYYE